MPSVLLLMGPTAAGKSALALALAERFGAELVCVDSATVYRGLDAGTAKPDAAERARVRHHLIDVISPLESYSAARFRHEALQAIADIHARGRRAILVGGTMLYFRALLEGLDELPGADPDVRAAIDQRARAEGWPALHAELAKVDPTSAARLKPTDAQRIQRALEVWQLTGQPLSALHGRARGAAVPGAAPHWIRMALLPSDRSVLHARIAQRFARMLEGGLVEELRALRHALPTLRRDLPAMRCVGYRQAWDYLEGEIDLAGLHQRGVVATRQLAKRQLTWLRALGADVALDCLRSDLLSAGLDAAAPLLAAA